MDAGTVELAVKLAVTFMFMAVVAWSIHGVATLPKR